MDLVADQPGLELEPFRPYLLVIARMMLDHRLRPFIDPEDAVQDAFVKAIRSWNDCKVSRKAWLRGILLKDLQDKVDYATAQMRNGDRKVDLETSSRPLAAIL